jgi:hypothetical protein
MHVEARRPCVTNGYASKRPHHEGYGNWIALRYGETWLGMQGSEPGCEPTDCDRYDYHRQRLALVGLYVRHCETLWYISRRSA